MSKGKRCQNILKDPFFLVMYFVSLKLTFNLMRNLEVKEYCEGRNRAKCYNESLWKSNYATGP